MREIKLKTNSSQIKMNPLDQFFDMYFDGYSLFKYYMSFYFTKSKNLLDLRARRKVFKKTPKFCRSLRLGLWARFTHVIFVN